MARHNTWPDDSGNAHGFIAYPYSASNNRLSRAIEINAIPDTGAGIYIFARKSSTANAWTSLLVGETDDLHHQLLDHYELDRLRNHGVTHVHVRNSSGSKADRLLLARSLRRTTKPLLNSL